MRLENDAAHALTQLLLRPVVNFEKVNRLQPGSTVLIHIGKCGGSSLKKALRASGRINELNAVHVRRPPVRRDLKYYIVARSPLGRALSAFNWRLRLVVDEADQAERFSGELRVLTKYRTLSNLGETLYDQNGAVNREAHRDIRKIHHLREDINFYLGDLLSVVDPDQIVEVLMQETLDADILRVFNYANGHREKSNLIPDEAETRERLVLTDRAERNLRYFFRRDYACLMQLYCMGKISKDVFAKIL